MCTFPSFPTMVGYAANHLLVHVFLVAARSCLSSYEQTVFSPVVEFVVHIDITYSPATSKVSQVGIYKKRGNRHVELF